LFFDLHALARHCDGAGVLQGAISGKQRSWDDSGTTGGVELVDAKAIAEAGGDLPAAGGRAGCWRRHRYFSVFHPRS